MATGGPSPTTFNIDKVQEDVLKLWNVVKFQISQEQKNRMKAMVTEVKPSRPHQTGMIHPILAFFLDTMLLRALVFWLATLLRSLRTLMSRMKCQQLANLHKRRPQRSHW